MIRAYETGDAFKVDAQPAQEDEMRAMREQDFGSLEAFTLTDGNGKVCGVFGFRVDGGGGAECFALLGKGCRKELLAAVRFWRRQMDIEIARRHLTRVTMTVKCGFAAGERLAGLLGFYPAGRLKNFFNNNDYQLFERRKQ